jgi:hypothetical protein
VAAGSASPLQKLRDCSQDRIGGLSFQIGFLVFSMAVSIVSPLLFPRKHLNSHKMLCSPYGLASMA